MTTNATENPFATEGKVTSHVCRADDLDDGAREMVCVAMVMFVNKGDVFRRRGDMTLPSPRPHSLTTMRAVFHNTLRTTCENVSLKLFI